MLNNLDYTGKIQRIDGDLVTVKINEPLNLERLKTVFKGYTGDREADIRIRDPRSFSPEQRAFTFALMNDIYFFTGQPFESLKEMFYWKYQLLTGKRISLADVSENTKDDIALLDNIILDFIFEWSIPFKNGYEILPMNRQYYFYKCVTTRTCCVCGKPDADIDHFSKALGRRDRKSVDHSEYDFAALCREHHQIKHQMGITEFKNKYHVEGIKLNKEMIKELRIGG